MIKDQYQAILNVLNGLKGAGQPLVEVFGWPKAIPEVFPVAMIDSQSGEQIDEATNLKILVNNFIVRLIFRQQDLEAAYIQRLEVTDRVLQEFTKLGVADYLNNTATKMDISHEFFVVNSEQPIFGVDIFIKTELVMEVA